MFGLTLACVQCLLIPFDIAFNGAEFNPLPTIWQVCYIGTAVYCFGVAPFFLVFYTSDEFSSCVFRSMPPRVAAWRSRLVDLSARSLLRPALHRS